MVSLLPSHQRYQSLTFLTDIARWDDLKGEHEVGTLPELFESGLKIARDKPCLGYRAVISTEPTLKFADEYTWETFATVDERRKAVGSAVEGLFRSGRFPINADFEGVGLWAVNRPGECRRIAALRKCG